MCWIFHETLPIWLPIRCPLKKIVYASWKVLKICLRASKRWLILTNSVRCFDHCGDVLICLLINTNAPSHWLKSVAWLVGPVLKFRDIPDCSCVFYFQAQEFNWKLSQNQSCNWAFAVPYHYIMVFIYYILIAAAGNAFMEAAQLQITLQSKHEAGQRFVDAGNCFKKTDVEGNKFGYFLVKLQSWRHSIMCCIQGGIVTEVIEGLTGFITSNNYLSMVRNPLIPSLFLGKIQQTVVD